MVLSYVGVISLLMQGFGIGAITARFPEKAILQFSTVTLTIAYFILVRRTMFLPSAVKPGIVVIIGSVY